MKNTISVLTVFLILGLNTSFIAQSDKSQTKPGGKKEMKNAPPEERAKMEAKKAEKQLGLDNDQKIKWEAAALQRIKANIPLREKLSGATTPDERKKLHEVAKSNRDIFETTVSGILKPEQVTKYEEVKKQRRDRIQKRKETKGAEKTKPELEDIDD
jgi:hypothetical protein